MMEHRSAAKLRLATPLILTSAVALCSGNLTRSASDDSPLSAENLAYDQVGRVLANTPPPPPSPQPGGFAADAQRIANLPALPKADGIFAGMEATRILGSNPLTAAAAQVSAIALSTATKVYTAKVTEVGQAYLRAGSLTHEWFYRGWRRTEAPALHSVTISKQEQGLEIYIDQAARTYREKHAAPADGEVYTVAASDDVRVSFGGGSAPTFKPLDAMVLDGHTAHGYQADAAFSLSGPLGFCSKGNHVLIEVEYVSDIPDPQMSAGPALEGSALVREVCMPTGGGSHREPGHLVLFRSMSITGGGVYGDLVAVLERGNLRAVRAEETTLFTAPKEYKAVP
jgi:hypothetical protein